MPKTIETTVYTYAELSDKAKEEARQWYIESLDHEWWDSVYDDAMTIGKLMGFDIENIYFRGFWSQGDGAQFIGSAAYAKGCTKAVKDYAPKDETLANIAERWQALQKRNFYQLSARIKSSGNYQHEYCTDIDVSRSDDKPVSSDDEEDTKDILRDFMRWIYRQLQEEYNYLTSDEAIAESMEVNAYTFTESGKCFG